MANDKIRLGLLGKNIQHSKSKAMYEKLLSKEVDYHLFDYNEANEIPMLDELFSKVSGLSITTPYKDHFLSSVQLDSHTQELGAINCIVRKENGYHGHNTDYLALRSIVGEKFSGDDTFKVILGNGAMAKVTIKVLEELDLKYSHFTRENSGDLSNLDLLTLRALTKPLVVFNACSRSFCYQGKISKDSIFYDFNYSLDHHASLAEKCDYVDGLDLLLKQAEFALKLWRIPE
ncbi:shikimate dehydrogenase substrate-binding domain protein [Bacteriovorax sp. BSW11_IV]|uniref:shikimate dehydrogenase substrate-binding domain protein n=1 Tax=Bacteriovorax sp. BSW11_IV TaxID=1353529 RepID=UPI00038A0C25|nr:shikimate dehydrogenase substrate-binding domain protein [Bacteriovorax sp. BSW11_IV]EQC47006.1 shikimate dehydrogenase substrate-binding domain protein [Bacteriovorax sp. BSW11_IV]